MQIKITCPRSNWSHFWIPNCWEGTGMKHSQQEFWQWNPSRKRQWWVTQEAPSLGQSLSPVIISSLLLQHNNSVWACTQLTLDQFKATMSKQNRARYSNVISLDNYAWILLFQDKQFKKMPVMAASLNICKEQCRLCCQVTKNPEYICWNHILSQPMFVFCFFYFSNCKSDMKVKGNPSLKLVIWMKSNCYRQKLTCNKHCFQLCCSCSSSSQTSD